MTYRFLAFLLFVAQSAAVLHGRAAEGLGRGWTGEFELAARQLVALAEATPEDKFSFRPAPGVRSTSELYMHVAIGNYGLLYRAGVKPGGQHWPDKIEANAEKKVTAKADVVRWLKDSLAAVRVSHAKVDGKKVVKFLSADVPASNVLLRILVHNHEHMGQAIAYARMSGVTPPWSK
ncbi:MAG: DinB family protein [Bryobacteraceae bacterium]|nr:DinB family protein [Bryobacteraceae bacterium]